MEDQIEKPTEVEKRSDKGDSKNEDSGKKRKREKKHSSSSDSGSESSSSSTSASSEESDSEDSDDRRKRQKKEKKKEKKRKERKKEKKKKDKKKKDKGKKKKKDKDKDRDHRSNLNDQCGSRGFIRVGEKFQKQDEFRCWLSEHKSIDYGMLGMKERDELWSEFVEDFNTATLPHDKYYNLQEWEQKLARKKSQKLAKLHKKAKNSKGGGGAMGRDEDIRAQELAEERQKKATAEYKDELVAMQLQHQAKEKDAMAKILAMAMDAKRYAAPTL